MDNNSIERMKKLIEEKKQSSAKQGFKKNNKENNTGASSKAIKIKKGGGLFDKQNKQIINIKVQDRRADA